MKLLLNLSIAVLASKALALQDRNEHGFVGYGINAMDPTCAFACRDSISSATLRCSEVMTHDMGGMSGMGDMVMTDPGCYATNDAFLQTLAWCIKSHCQDVPTWKLEQFWLVRVPGNYIDQPNPQYTYQEALVKIRGVPNATYDGTGNLNETSVVSEDLWFPAYNTDTIFIHQESQQEKYG